MTVSKVLAALILAVASKVSLAQWPCKNVTWIDQGHTNESEPTGNTTCFENAMWAKDYGVIAHPDWYPGLTKDSPVNDFQWAIYAKSGSVAPGVSWHCDLPCGLEQKALSLGLITPFPTSAPTLLPTLMPTLMPTMPPTNFTVLPAAVPESGSSLDFPWWAWLLLALLLLACCGICLYLAGVCGKPKPQKKKQTRAVARPAPAPPPPVVAAPAPTVSTALPVAMPVQQRSMVVTTAPPVYAAPATTAVAAPMPYVAPQPMTYAAPQPMAYAAPQQVAYAPAPAAQMGGAMSLFDALDRDHNGSISRAELAAALGR